MGESMNVFRSIYIKEEQYKHNNTYDNLIYYREELMGEYKKRQMTTVVKQSKLSKESGGINSLLWKELAQMVLISG